MTALSELLKVETTRSAHGPSMLSFEVGSTINYLARYLSTFCLYPSWPMKETTKSTLSKPLAFALLGTSELCVIAKSLADQADDANAFLRTLELLLSNVKVRLEALSKSGCQSGPRDEKRVIKLLAALEALARVSSVRLWKAKLIPLIHCSPSGPLPSSHHARVACSSVRITLNLIILSSAFRKRQRSASTSLPEASFQVQQKTEKSFTALSKILPTRRSPPAARHSPT